MMLDVFRLRGTERKRYEKGFMNDHTERESSMKRLMAALSPLLLAASVALHADAAVDIFFMRHGETTWWRRCAAPA